MAEGAGWEPDDVETDEDETLYEAGPETALDLVREVPEDATALLVIGLSLFLSFFVMAPAINQINTTAIQPYSQGRIGATQLISTAAPTTAPPIGYTSEPLPRFSRVSPGATSIPSERITKIPSSAGVKLFLSAS